MDDVRPESRPASRRKRGFLRSQIGALLVIAVLLLLAGLASLPWLISSPERVSRFIAEAVPELQADVGIGSMRLGWFGPIVIENLRLVPRDGSVTPIAIRRIEGSHGLAGMLLSAGDLGRIRFEGLEADIVFTADRQSNLAGLFRPAGHGPATAAEGPPPGEPGTARRSPFRTRLEVEDAVVRITGPWTPDPWVSDPIDVTATLAPHAGGGWSEWTIDPVQLLTDARLEPGVAQGVLAYIAPVLADATRTAGRFSLRLDGARLPVGQPEAGTLSGELAMHEVILGPGPMVAKMFSSLPGGLAPPPAIRVADESHVAFRLADQKVWHKGLEFGLPLAKPGQRLDVESSGSVGLADGALDLVLKLPIPSDLPQDRPVLAALAGKTVSLGIGGSLDTPQVNFNGSIKAAAGEFVTDLVDRLRGRTQPPAPAWAPPNPVPGQAQNTSQAPAKDRVQEPAQDQDVAQDPAQRPAQNPASRPTPPQNASGGPGAVQPPAAGDKTAEQILDIVGGVLDEVAKRRAERRAADPASVPPPRRGGLLRRLAQPPQQPASEPAPAP